MSSKLGRAACAGLALWLIPAVAVGEREPTAAPRAGSAAVFREIFVPAQGFSNVFEPAAFAAIGTGLVALGILRGRKQA